MSARTAICAGCSNPVPATGPEPDWHRVCDRYRPAAPVDRTGDPQ